MSAIKHMVVFSLHSGKGDAESERFLQISQEELAAIPGVEQFQIFHQVSPKTDYDYGFSMVFADEQAYASYNDHPVHVRYVQERWKTGVSRFQEIDLVLHQ
ncbi:Dabb family protein [Paenibacillus paeoniae]|nr:Dabb family protein [Paenibacillus paeoniae]